MDEEIRHPEWHGESDRNRTARHQADGSLDVASVFAKIAGQGRQKQFGWSALDRLGLGLNPGELAIVAGRTGHGKSTALLNILANWLGAPETSEEIFLLYSHEIPQEAVAVKLLSILTRVHGSVGWSYHQVRNWAQTQAVPEGLHQHEIEEAIRTLGRWQKKLVVHYQPSWNAIDVEQSAKELQRAGQRIGGIFVDYIQLVSPPPGSYESLEHEVTATAKHLKRLGVDLSCPVIAAAQIGREAADIAGWIPEGDIEDERVIRTIAKRRPQLHHLRQGGGEQEADLVIGLLNYRADYIAALEENDGTRQRLESVGTSGQFDVAVIKNRYGVLGIAPLVLESHSGYVRDPGVFGR